MKIFTQTEPILATLEEIAADKSLSHRAAIFSLLSNKPSKIENYLLANDTLHTLDIVEKLGAKVHKNGSSITIEPPITIKEPNEVLECGNSGTTMRLFLGFLAVTDGFFVLSGDRYLNKRPMRRVLDPLGAVGAKFDGVKNGEYAPIAIRGKKLDYFKFESKIPSAQVKSAMILAGLKSSGCSYKEPELSRDHSEKMLKGMGADIKTDGLVSYVKPLNSPLSPLSIKIPSDPSSAFYFAVAAAITPGSKVVLKDLLLNKTRVKAYEILAQMGAKIEFIKKESLYEEIGDIVVEYAPLKAVDIKENISWLIDEAPALAMAFVCASGKSSLRNAKELRVKECDRIKVVVEGLRACKIEVEEFDDGFAIKGGNPQPAIIDSNGDHRIAMSFAILGLRCGMIIEDAACIDSSFPKFKTLLKSVGVSVED